MASIGTTLPTTSTGTSATSSSSSSSNSLASQQTFLQLLVAQLQNQDPTQPVQGTEFVTQLATFTDVEQNLGVRQDMDGVTQQYLGYVPSGGTVVPNSNSSSSSSSSTSGTSGTTSTSGG